MRIITKDIQLSIDGSPLSFRLTKPDAFSGVEILRGKPRSFKGKRLDKKPVQWYTERSVKTND